MPASMDSTWHRLNMYTNAVAWPLWMPTTSSLTCHLTVNADCGMRTVYSRPRLHSCYQLQLHGAAVAHQSAMLPIGCCSSIGGSRRSTTRLWLYPETSGDWKGFGIHSGVAPQVKRCKPWSLTVVLGSKLSKSLASISVGDTLLCILLWTPREVKQNKGVLMAKRCTVLEQAMLYLFALLFVGNLMDQH